MIKSIRTDFSTLYSNFDVRPQNIIKTFFCRKGYFAKDKKVI